MLSYTLLIVSIYGFIRGGYRQNRGTFHFMITSWTLDSGMCRWVGSGSETFCYRSTVELLNAVYLKWGHRVHPGSWLLSPNGLRWKCIESHPWNTDTTIIRNADTYTEFVPYNNIWTASVFRLCACATKMGRRIMQVYFTPGIMVIQHNA